MHSRKPNFIGIGPTKTGTSWLYLVLRMHPEIWLPPVSEINYFWGMGYRRPQPTLLRKLKQRIKGDIRMKWRRTYARQRWEFYHQQPDQRTWRNVNWDLKYLFLPQNPSWYHSLFQTDKLAGDISGGYFTLDDQAIQKLARHLPDAKIIMCFRDPVSRLWSEAKMMLMFIPGKTYDQVSDAAFFHRFNIAMQRLPSYHGLYQRWCKYFPQEQVMPCYYDDLVTDPEAYVQRICAHLKTSTTLTPAMHELLHSKVFEGPRVELPDHFRNYLIEKTLPLVQELVDVTGHPQPCAWLKKYQQILDESKT